jgi:Rhodanese-like domain
MGRKLGLAFILASAITLCVLPNLWAAADMTTMVQKNCMKCHSDFGKMDHVIAGNLSSKSTEGGAIQIKINNKLEMIKFTPETQLSNVPGLKSLKNGMAMRVHYEQIGNDRVATKIVVKPKIKVADEQLITVAELTKLIEIGPEKGNYTLVDSRPGPGYLKGHLPTAISIPFPKMKDMLNQLPKDKDSLVIFYCQGYR